MGEVIELNSKKPPRDKDEDEATTWTIVEALESTINDIKEGNMEMPSHMYIAMLIPSGDEHRVAYVQAGMKNAFETIGVLEIHSGYHSGYWHETE